MDKYTESIKSVGFPIVAFGLMFAMVWVQNTRSTDTLNALNESVKLQTQVVEDNITTLEGINKTVFDLDKSVQGLEEYLKGRDE